MTRRQKHCLALSAGFLVSGTLLAVQSAYSQEVPAGDPRAALRNDPEYAKLYHDGVSFLELPAAKQEAMRKLHHDLHKLPSAERLRLKESLTRYADWLDKQPEADRQAVVNAANGKVRLQTIKKRREKEWLAKQPKATQQYLAKLPKFKTAEAAASALGMALGTTGPMRPIASATLLVTESTDLRAETIARLKRDDTRKAREWTVATRHWAELTDPKKTMPAHAADFGPEVETFVKEYLKPMLDEKELAQLQKAEGHWPLYPMTLVELADKHPMALPQRHGPTLFKDLPTEVQKRLSPKMFPGKENTKKKDFDQFFLKQANANGIDARVKAVLPLRDQTPSAKFAVTVANYAHSKKGGVKLPHELWAAQPKDMSVPMRVFLDEKGPFWTGLTFEEHSALQLAVTKWPEYPLKIQELAKKYGLTPPWQTLPDVANKSDVWDKYRMMPHARPEAPLPAGLKRDPVIQARPPSSEPK